MGDHDDLHRRGWQGFIELTRHSALTGRSTLDSAFSQPYVRDGAALFSNFWSETTIECCRRPRTQYGIPYPGDAVTTKGVEDQGLASDRAVMRRQDEKIQKAS